METKQPTPPPPMVESARPFIPSPDRRWAGTVEMILERDTRIMWGLIIGGFFVGLGHASRPILDYVHWFLELRP